MKNERWVFVCDTDNWPECDFETKDLELAGTHDHEGHFPRFLIIDGYDRLRPDNLVENR